MLGGKVYWVEMLALPCASNLNWLSGYPISPYATDFDEVAENGFFLESVGVTFKKGLFFVAFISVINGLVEVVFCWSVVCWSCFCYTGAYSTTFACFSVISIT